MSARLRRLAISSALPWALAPGVFACAVCFGQGDNPDVARAYAWAIAILLGCTFGILAFLCYAIYRIEVRRKRQLHSQYFGGNGARPLPKELAPWAAK